MSLAVLLTSSVLTFLLGASAAVVFAHPEEHEDSAPVSIEVNRPPEKVGRWLEPMPWPVNGIHAALLRTGEVLHYSYLEAVVWSPTNGTMRDVAWRDNLFCSGLSFLPNGRLYVTGGTTEPPPGCVIAGLTITHTFDPLSRAWQRRGHMAGPRWYPTNLTLGDGRVMILSGLDDKCELNTSMEIYTPGQGLALIPEGERVMDLYPRVHLLPSGKVAYVAQEPETYTFDLSTRQWTQVATTRDARPRIESTSFMVPGKPNQIMVCGGYVDDNDPSRLCDRIDFADPKPRWRRRARLQFKRAHLESVILPDGKVLIMGGGKHGEYDEPILNPEMYNPRTNRLELIPPQSYGRMYHATALLLPDGRVLSAGQDDSLEDGVQSGEYSELYEPAYLFRGPRPMITKTNKSVRYGRTFPVETPEAAEIGSVVLIRTGSTTHSLNTSQRYVALEFEQAGTTTLRVSAPEHGNLAPPGYYMLFILNGKGVPSVASMIRLRLGPTSPIRQGGSAAAAGPAAPDPGPGSIPTGRGLAPDEHDGYSPATLRAAFRDLQQPT